MWPWAEGHVGKATNNWSPSRSNPTIMSFCLCCVSVILILILSTAFTATGSGEWDCGMANLKGWGEVGSGWSSFWLCETWFSVKLLRRSQTLGALQYPWGVLARFWSKNIEFEKKYWTMLVGAQLIDPGRSLRHENILISDIGPEITELWAYTWCRIAGSAAKFAAFSLSLGKISIFEWDYLDTWIWNVDPIYITCTVRFLAQYPSKLGVSVIKTIKIEQNWPYLGSWFSLRGV